MYRLGAVQTMGKHHTAAGTMATRGQDTRSKQLPGAVWQARRESQRDTDPRLPPGRGSSLSQDSVICAARPPGLRARGQCARPWPRPERPSAEGGPHPAASDTSLYLPHSALGLSIPICTGARPDDRAL